MEFYTHVLYYVSIHSPVLLIPSLIFDITHPIASSNSQTFSWCNDDIDISYCEKLLMISHQYCKRKIYLILKGKTMFLLLSFQGLLAETNYTDLLHLCMQWCSWHACITLGLLLFLNLRSSCRKLIWGKYWNRSVEGVSLVTLQLSSDSQDKLISAL